MRLVELLGDVGVQLLVGVNLCSWNHEALKLNAMDHLFNFIICPEYITLKVERRQ